MVYLARKGKRVGRRRVYWYVFQRGYRDYREGGKVKTQYLGYAGVQPRSSIETPESFNESQELTSYRMMVRLFSSSILFMTGDLVIPAAEFFTILRSKPHVYQKIVGTDKLPDDPVDMFKQLRWRGKLDLEYDTNTDQIIVYSPLSLSVKLIDPRHASELAIRLQQEHKETSDFIAKIIQKKRARELTERALEAEEHRKQQYISKYMQHLKASEETRIEEAKEIHEELAELYKGLALGTHELIDDLLTPMTTEAIKQEEQEIMAQGKIPVRASYLQQLEVTAKELEKTGEEEVSKIPEF